jgi:hypothetical protein
MILNIRATEIFEKKKAQRFISAKVMILILLEESDTKTTVRKNHYVGRKDEKLRKRKEKTQTGWEKKRRRKEITGRKGRNKQDN